MWNVYETKLSLSLGLFMWNMTVRLDVNIYNIIPV